MSLHAAIGTAAYTNTDFGAVLSENGPWGR